VAGRSALSAEGAVLGRAAESLRREIELSCRPPSPACAQGVLAKRTASGWRATLQRKGARPPAASEALSDGTTLTVEPTEAWSQKRSSAASLLGAYLLLDALLVFVLGLWLFNRALARPVDRLVAAAERIGRCQLGEPSAA